MGIMVRRGIVSIAAFLAIASAQALAQEPPAPPPPPLPPASLPPQPAPAAAATPPAAGLQPAPEPATQKPLPGPGGVVVPEVKVIQPEPAKQLPKVAGKPVKPKQAAAAQPSQPATQKAPPAQSAAAAAPPAFSPAFATSPAPAIAAEVRLSPVGGSEISIDKVASGVATVSQADVARQGATSIQEVLQAKVPGVTLNDLQGSGFQTDIQYRGFTASPVEGVAQGLAVYQNGVRINEAFGDTVNLDLIPSNAIADITVIPNNPAFGLNAVGGAVSIGLKDGFGYHGGEIDGRVGSFGRRQGAVQAGVQSGAVAAYVAYEDIVDRGWRDNSPANIRRFYGDLGFKADGNEFHINLTRSNNSYGVVAAAPIQLLEQGGWGRTFTSPQTTVNDVLMPTVNASLTLNAETKLSGLAYYRGFNQHHVDGNQTNAADCADGTNTFCIGGPGTDKVLDQGGNPISSALTGEIDRTNISSDSYGGSAQIVNKSKLFGHANQFLIGVSFDHGVTSYSTSAEFGSIDPATLFITGSGTFASSPFDVAPRNLRGTNDYTGLFFSDAFDVTDAFTLTVGGRYNNAQITLKDLTGLPEAQGLNGTHTYERFNPMAGATYKLTRGLSLYGGYSEANRAPTVAELSCSDPNNPCVISTFLTSDPELKQVVARTFEVGARGEWKSSTGRQVVNANLGLFRTQSTDDILPIGSQAQARGYFANAGETLRQGLEASLSYRDERLMVYGAYNYLDATFQSPNIFPSPNNPQNGTGTDPYFIQVKPGDKIPNTPAHKFKAGIDYWMTPQWKLGVDMVAATDSFFRGDENNQNRTLAGYAVFNMHTSYDLSKNIQLYGLVNNLFDSRYSTYGAYVNLDNANALGNPIAFSDARSITPAAPFAAYGGLKIKF